jgi:hypothetical protein
MPEKKSTSTAASTTVSETGPGGSQLGRASYRAEQVRDTVIIFAMGWHPTPGYVDFFEQSPVDVFPPQFILRTIPPTGIVIQTLTPFAIWVMFGANEPVKTVTVHDADGAHDIDVAQLNVAEARQRGTWVSGNVMRAARAMAEQPTTMATGEESGGGPTTMATGEEETRLATTLALGEEGPGPTTLAVGEEGGFTTLRLGEEGPTTFALGEEEPATAATFTTAALGEETQTTLAVGEEDPTTKPVGEEGATTLALGEEEGGGIQFQRTNPFGGF